MDTLVCIINHTELYYMYNRIFKNLLKLRYRVQGRTTQENNRHSPCQFLILKKQVLFSVQQKFKNFVVKFDTTLCIICYLTLYHMYLTEHHIFIKMGVSNYTSPLCQFLTVTFRVFHNPVEKCCGIVEKCHLHAYVWIWEHCIKCT